MTPAQSPREIEAPFLEFGESVRLAQPKVESVLLLAFWRKSPVKLLHLCSPKHWGPTTSHQESPDATPWEPETEMELDDFEDYSEEVYSTSSLQNDSDLRKTSRSDTWHAGCDLTRSYPLQEPLTQRWHGGIDNL